MLTAAHTITTDEPASLGGTDTAPTPHELLTATLASCVSTMLVPLRETQGHRSRRSARRRRLRPRHDPRTSRDHHPPPRPPHRRPGQPPRKVRRDLPRSPRPRSRLHLQRATRNHPVPDARWHVDVPAPTMRCSSQRIPTSASDPRLPSATQLPRRTVRPPSRLPRSTTPASRVRPVWDYHRQSRRRRSFSPSAGISP